MHGGFLLWGGDSLQLWLRCYVTDEDRARHAKESPMDKIPPVNGHRGRRALNALSEQVGKSGLKFAAGNRMGKVFEPKRVVCFRPFTPQRFVA